MDGQKVYKGGGTEDVSWRLRFHIGSDCEHWLLWILVSEVIKGVGSVVTYNYVPLFRLIRELRVGSYPYSVSYEYDGAGNRMVKGWDGRRTEYVYDKAGRINFVACGVTATIKMRGCYMLVRGDGAEDVSWWLQFPMGWDGEHGRLRISARGREQHRPFGLIHL